MLTSTVGQTQKAHHNARLMQPNTEAIHDSADDSTSLSDLRKFGGCHGESCVCKASPKLLDNDKIRLNLGKQSHGKLTPMQSEFASKSCRVHACCRGTRSFEVPSLHDATAIELS